MNVAITRPRHFLFIVGNAETLQKNPFWDDLIDHHYSKLGAYFRLDQESYSESEIRQEVIGTVDKATLIQELNQEMH